MRYWYDTEFLDDGRTIELISIGIVAEDGREYYAVNVDMPTPRIRHHRWLMENVVPHLPLVTPIRERGWPDKLPPLFSLDGGHTCVKPHRVIANEVRDFLAHGLADGDRAELWAYYGAYDHVALAQLWGPMINLPKHVPMWTHELMQLWETTGRPTMPPKPVDEHDALADARWNHDLYRTCTWPGPF